MLDELRARFLPRFLADARQRIARSQAAIATANAAALAEEMHALTGEASMLGYTELATLAKDGERSARAVEHSCDAEAASTLAAKLAAVHAALDAIAAPTTTTTK